MTDSGVHADSAAGPDLLGVGAPASANCLRSRRKRNTPPALVRHDQCDHRRARPARREQRPPYYVQLIGTSQDPSFICQDPSFFVETTDGPGPGGMALRRAADGAMIGDVAGRKRRGPGTPSTRDPADPGPRRPGTPPP